MTVGGEVLVENLVNGEERLFKIPADGRLRVPIPADAADTVDKRGLSGMPEEGPGDEVWTVDNNVGLGDALRVTVWDAEGSEVAAIVSFEVEAKFEGITYPEGSPLVAAAEGLGHCAVPLAFAACELHRDDHRTRRSHRIRPGLH